MSIRSLNTTALYVYAEKASGSSLTHIAMGYSLLKNGTIVVSYDQIADAMYEITNRTSSYFAKNAIDNLVKSGRLTIVYNGNNEFRLTNAIPFFKRDINGRKSMIINITNFSTMRKDGTINIRSNVLYSLLLSAAFTMEIDNRIFSFMKDIYLMYSRLFTTIISNLAYLDNPKKEKIQYLATNFIFYQIYSPDKTFTNPMKGKLRYNSIEAIETLDGKMPIWGEHSAYENLEIFIDNLQRVFPEMKNLSLKNFLDRWAT